MNVHDVDRRTFLRQSAITLASLPLLASCASAQRPVNELLARLRQNGAADPSWSGAKDLPDSVTWRTVLATETDKGEPMLISGTVYAADGKTPAPNTLIYLYHTDFEGYYGRNGEHRHGRYRGWLLTDEQGRYEFRSIKAAPYPENRFAAHVHMTVTTTDRREDWVDSILFEGDRLISSQ